MKRGRPHLLIDLIMIAGQNVNLTAIGWPYICWEINFTKDIACDVHDTITSQRLNFNTHYDIHHTR